MIDGIRVGSLGFHEQAVKTSCLAEEYLSLWRRSARCGAPKASSWFGKVSIFSESENNISKHLAATKEDMDWEI